MSAPKKTAILLVVCPDRPGLVATFSNFVHQNNGNIVDLDQHTDYETGTYLMRLEWELEGFALQPDGLRKSLKKISSEHPMKFGIHFSQDRLRMAIMVSQYQHCLYDLLVRQTLGEWNVDIPLILSNHPELREVAAHFNIPFELIPVTPDNKNKAEEKQLELLQKNRIDLVVLARYMQILSENFVNHFPDSIINVHHSFLPAFIGGKPYHQAYSRGVKLIGATSHYVTTELDNGPIIDQRVTRVSHLDRVEDMIRKGRDLEKVVLAFAVRMHLEHRVLTYGNKTVVFE